MKNKIIILAMLFLSSIITSAQLTTNLILNNRPPANLSDWALRKDVVTLIITNQSPDIRAVKIKVSIKTIDGTEVANTDLNLAKSVALVRGNNVFNAAIVFPLEVQRFNGKYQNILNRTGKLQADNYQFCVDVVEPTTFQPFAPAMCKMFYVASTQLPILMMPYDEQIVEKQKAQTAIIFRWTPLTPNQQTQINYRLQIFEILANQQPVQALRANQPILDKIITNQTQFIWQPQGILNYINANDSMYVKVDSSFAKTRKVKDIMLDTVDKQKSAVKYIWTIQTTDGQGVPFNGSDGNGEGRSEPKIFVVR